MSIRSLTMAFWLSNLKLRDLLEQYGDELEAGGDELELVPKYAKLTAERIKGGPVEARMFAGRFLKAKTEAGYNRIMSALYDWCDNRRIWVE